MNQRIRRSIIATLLRAGRPDLANAAIKIVASSILHTGEDIWGKNAKLHIFMSSIRLEEFPPGGKVKGKKTRVLSYYWGTVNDENVILLNKLMTQLVKDIHVAPFEQLSAAVKMWANKIDGHTNNVEESEQKAVNAPNPTEHAKAPPPHQNKSGVHIEFRPADRSVTVRDTLDRNNDPTAFTQGPRAYQLALKTYGEWQNLQYHDLLRYWSSTGIKYHDYLAMD